MKMRRIVGRIGDFVLKDITSAPTLSNVGMIIGGGPGLSVEQVGVLATRPVNMLPRLFMSSHPMPIGLLGARVTLDRSGAVRLEIAGEAMSTLSSGIPSWFGSSVGLAPISIRKVVAELGDDRPQISWEVPAQAVVSISKAGSMMRAVLVGDGEPAVRQEWIARTAKSAVATCVSLMDSLGYAYWHIRGGVECARVCEAMDIPNWRI